MSETPRTIRAQIGPFAMVPLWILDRCHDSRAIHLYALLGKYANRERRAWPKLETLAEDMGVVQRTVERAVATLRDAGALHTERRRRADGSVLGLDFLLVHTLPDEPLPDTGVGLVEAAQPDTGVGLADRLPDTGVGTIPTLVSGPIKEPDPLEPDRKAVALPRAYPAGSENAADNVAVITKLAHEVLNLYDGVSADYGELDEAVKRRCALYHIAYTSGVVTAAMESALFQRRLAGKGAMVPGSVGESAYRAKGGR